MPPESSYNGPVHLECGAQGARVLVLGAGIAGATAGAVTALRSE